MNVCLPVLNWSEKSECVCECNKNNMPQQLGVGSIIIVELNLEMNTNNEEIHTLTKNFEAIRGVGNPKNETELKSF